MDWIWLLASPRHSEMYFLTNPCHFPQFGTNNFKPNSFMHYEGFQIVSIRTPSEHTFQSESIHTIRRSSTKINQNSIWTNFLINFNPCIPEKFKPNQYRQSKRYKANQSELNPKTLFKANKCMQLGEVQTESIRIPSEQTF